MAVDEALFNASRRDTGMMTLRIYSWNPPAVSLGYGQEVAGEIDPGQCDRYGIELVRRITGGRTVLHDQELTYSLVAPESHPALGNLSGVMIRRVSEALIGTMRYFGIPGELAPDGRCGMGKGDVCFSATGRYEITVHGRKLARQCPAPLGWTGAPARIHPAGTGAQKGCPCFYLSTITNAGRRSPGC